MTVFCIKVTKVYVGSMKVAIIAYGHADNVICLAKHLSESSDVTLIFITPGDHFTRSILDLDLRNLPFGLTTDRQIVRQYIGGDLEKYLNGSLNLYIARMPSRSIIRDWPRRNLMYIKQIATFLRSNSFDVVHFNGFSGFQLYFHRYLRGIPKVYTIHDYLPHTGEWKLTPLLLNRLYSRLDYQFIQHYDYLSKSFAKFYGIDSAKVHTVYCGPLEVYNSFVTKKIEEETRTILFFGRISPYKGIEYLTSAVPDVRRHIPELKCIIAGSGTIHIDFDNDGEYEVYNHYISNSEIVNLIQRASLIVLPYTDATHSAVLMTAYAFSKPVVASAVGGIPEVVVDNVTGHLVPPRDVQALGAAIIDILDNEHKRERMKQNIKNMCASGNLSWTRITDSTLAVYEKALRR